ncbi:hypothetical protein [Thermoleptolyngbya sp. C42_A2020_037]|uniref:hypothetical protein n=1 Tax=Thermoleptolyngbya sp. C42_A2020_037 TaxID=2747799 RepID=UPI0019F93F8C|nr:hypothetical protein [Thermoleptolyngbya sp. C42_A2020_037]MBF2087092.1 hypothetical protein [Thermoleptolyngbya sp. C42_A2020_037]
MRQSSASNRVAAFLCAFLVLALSGMIYLEVQGLGFPDGFLTELDRAKKLLGLIFLWVSLPIALWLGWLGWVAARQPIGRLLRSTILGYGAFLLILLGIYGYLQQTLDAGGGG